MSKYEYMERHGIKIRRVTEQDRAAANTDYQRTADYILSYAGREWFSKRGTLEDMKALVLYRKQSLLDYNANGRPAKH